MYENLRRFLVILSYAYSLAEQAGVRPTYAMRTVARTYEETKGWL